MEKLRQMIVRNFVHHFYILTSSSFVIWMVFFDGNDLLNQYNLHRKLQELKQEKEYYIENIKKIDQERAALRKNTELLEKLAREKYFLKKKGEEVYIIKDDK